MALATNGRLGFPHGAPEESWGSGEGLGGGGFEGPKGASGADPGGALGAPFGHDATRWPNVFFAPDLMAAWKRLGAILEPSWATHGRR